MAKEEIEANELPELWDAYIQLGQDIAYPDRQ
jgi:hypothetical protein